MNSTQSISPGLAVAHNDDVSARSHMDVLTVVDVGEVCVFTFMDPLQVLVFESTVAR
jgi:hypothetical protein